METSLPLTRIVVPGKADSMSRSNSSR